MSNKQYGTIIVTGRMPVTHEGIVQVSAGGVRVSAREFGRQTRVDKYYTWPDVIAHSDDGEGFVTVMEDIPVVVFNGIASSDDDSISVETEGGRVITAFPARGNAVSTRLEYDSDESGPSTTLGKEGKRRSARFDTKSERSDSKPKKTSVAKKTSKAGKRR